MELEIGYSNSHSSGVGVSYGGVARSWGGHGEEKISECTAAMVLMRLSASPKERGIWRDLIFSPEESSSGSSSERCPGSPCSPPTPTPSPTFLDYQEEESCKRPRPSQVVFECTWRGCKQREDSQDNIERHVRGHLGRPEPEPTEPRDYEEEFYYTEIDQDILDVMEAIPELPTCTNQDQDTFKNPGEKYKSQEEQLTEAIVIDTKDVPTVNEEETPFSKLLSSSCPSFLAEDAPSNLSAPSILGASSPLGDHLDMARPAHEAPTIIIVNNISGTPNKTSKFIQIYPRPGKSQETTANNPQSLVFKTGSNRSVLRTEKKCRKVYGIEKRELWCTQCKWKKACARFQEA
jgi:hypothetical protein